MADLKHRLYWIDRIENGMKTVRISESDPEFYGFFIKYYTSHNMATAKKVARAILNDLVEEKRLTTTILITARTSPILYHTNK